MSRKIDYKVCFFFTMPKASYVIFIKGVGGLQDA